MQDIKAASDQELEDLKKDVREAWNLLPKGGGRVEVSRIMDYPLSSIRTYLVGGTGKDPEKYKTCLRTCLKVTEQASKEMSAAVKRMKLLIR